MINGNGGMSGMGGGGYDNFAWGMFTQTGMIGYYLLSREINNESGEPMDGVNPPSHRGPFD